MCLYCRPRAPNGWGVIKGGWGRPPAPRVEVSRPIRLSEAVANRLDWPLLPGGRHTSYPTSSCVPCGSRHVKKMIEDAGWSYESLGGFQRLLSYARSCARITTSVPAGCISTWISQSHKLCKYRVVLNMDLRSLSRGGNTSPCLQTRNFACLAKAGMQKSWFAGSRESKLRSLRRQEGA